MFTRPSRPSLFRLPSRGKGADLPPLSAPEQREPDTDEYGLLYTMTQDMSPLGRQYLARCMEFMNLDKTVPPVQQGFGTIPEAVFFGGLLERDFTFGAVGSQSFEYQSATLGGRQSPGGTVIDFILHSGNRRIAVYVESVFHTKANPFGGMAKIGEDDARFTRALATRGIDALVQVNRGGEGHPLEHGPDALVVRDFQRALSAG